MNLKTIIAKRILTQQKAKRSRNVQVANFDSAKSIGILWSLDEEEAFQFLQKKLKEKKNLSVENLCFIQGKMTEEQPENSFGKTDITWLGFPKNEKVNSFYAKKYDILIDLTVSKKFPLIVVACLSSALFKVGYGTPEWQMYDLSIDVSQRPEPLYLVQQMVNYLEQINKKTHDNTSV